MDLGAELLALLIVVLVKGAVLVLGSWLLLRLYQASYAKGHVRRLWLLLPDRDRPEVKLLWWSLVCFFVSELTCGVEVYILFQSSVVLSTVHAVSSAVGMGIFALGAYRFVDKKFIAYGQKRCLLNRVCMGCPVVGGGRCKFSLISLLGATFVGLMTFAPMCASTAQLSAHPERYILPFPALNRWYDGELVPWLQLHIPGYERSGIAYVIPESILVLEWKILPGIVLGLCVCAVVMMRLRKQVQGVHVFVFATGMLCYSYFQLILYRGVDDLLLGSLGHEVAEFWFLVMVVELLRRIFPPLKEQKCVVDEIN